MAIITDKHVQKLIINQAVAIAHNTLNGYQGVQRMLSGGASIMPASYQNGFYDSFGDWHDYLLTDYNAINEGVLK